MTRLLGRVWLPLVIVVVVAVAVFTVGRIRTFFGAPSATTGASVSSGITPFNPKVVTYDIFGAGAPGRHQLPRPRRPAAKGVRRHPAVVA